MKKIIRVILIHFILLSSTYLYAKNDDGYLVVGTKIAPPFVMKKANGELYGVSIDLWKEIAKKLNLQYKFQEDTLEGLMDKIKNKDVEIAIAAITASAKRERFADFSNAYYTEELAIAIPRYSGTIYKSLFNKLFSITTLWVIFGIIVVIFIAGLAFWLMERSDKKEGEDSINKLSNGIWWATVTMATIGRSNIVPRTLGGKIVALIWMILSMFLIAIIIAAFASFFSTAKKEYFITSPEDLNKGTIATVSGSFSDDYLRKRGLVPIYYNTLKEALNAVKNGDVDAVVYDRELLKYLIDKYYYDTVELAPAHFMPQSYSLIFKEGCVLKEPINRAVLDILESSKWKQIKDKYLLKANNF
jgi:ABC-type amino acid transport substrate-binding protein